MYLKKETRVQAFDALDGHQRGIRGTRPYHIVSLKSAGLDTNITTCQRITVTVISKEQQKSFREENKPEKEGLEMRTRSL
nr:hypothetical protein [Tanacetum cinerariifolium]